MRRRPELEDRLARVRWRTATAAARTILQEEVGLGADSFSFVDYEDAKEHWERYIPRVRAQNDLLLQWPATDVAGARSWLNAVRLRSRGRRVSWFAHADVGVPPVADVPLEDLLEHGIDVFPMKGRDLMIASFDLSDGLCLELNPVGLQDEFEAAAWGSFAETEH